jgi:hypothetical protein
VLSQDCGELRADIVRDLGLLVDGEAPLDLDETGDRGSLVLATTRAFLSDGEICESSAEQGGTFQEAECGDADIRDRLERLPAVELRLSRLETDFVKVLGGCGYRKGHPRSEDQDRNDRFHGKSALAFPAPILPARRSP